MILHRYQVVAKFNPIQLNLETNPHSKTNFTFSKKGRDLRGTTMEIPSLNYSYNKYHPKIDFLSSIFLLRERHHLRNDSRSAYSFFVDIELYLLPRHYTHQTLKHPPPYPSALTHLTILQKEHPITFFHRLWFFVTGATKEKWKKRETTRQTDEKKKKLTQLHLIYQALLVSAWRQTTEKINNSNGIHLMINDEKTLN